MPELHKWHLKKWKPYPFRDSLNETEFWISPLWRVIPLAEDLEPKNIMEITKQYWNYSEMKSKKSHYKAEVRHSPDKTEIDNV